MTGLAAIIFFDKQAISVGRCGPVNEARGVSGAIFSEAVKIEALPWFWDTELAKGQAARSRTFLRWDVLKIFGGGEHQEWIGCGIEAEAEGREDAEGVGGDEAGRSDFVGAPFVETGALVAHGCGRAWPHECGAGELMVRSFVGGEEVDDKGFEGGEKGAVLNGESDSDKLIFEGLFWEFALDSKLTGDSSSVEPEDEEGCEDPGGADEEESELEEESVNEAEATEENHPIAECVGFWITIVFGEVIHKVPEEERERMNF